MYFSCLKWVNYFSPEWNEYMAFLTGECEHECIYEWLFFYVKKDINEWLLSCMSLHEWMALCVNMN